MGSVKDLNIITKATNSNCGLGIFKFSDRYSVFDYGEMPNLIESKGETICRMSSYNFRELKKIGIKSHFRAMKSPTEMEVELVQVLDPAKGEISMQSNNYLIPLEMIYRNSLPKGSSVFKRIENGEVSLDELGLTEMPTPGEKLETPILDVSTKLEAKDRYLSWSEAKKMSGLTDEQFEDLRNKTLKINDFVSKKAKSIGLENADGKVEFGFDCNNEIILVDVLGTLDENRFLFNDMHLSKQVLRDYYKEFTSWDGTNGKPEKIPEELVEIVSNMYKSVCEAWTGEKIWHAPTIKQIVSAYNDFLTDLRMKKNEI